MSESMLKYVAQASGIGVSGQLILLIFISFIMGLGKGGVPGFATIATALVVSTAPVDIQGGLGYAVALMVPILTMIDIYAAWLHKDSLDWSTVFFLLPTSFMGMVLGQFLDRYLTDSSARILVGSILLGLLFLRLRIDINVSGTSNHPQSKPDPHPQLILPITSSTTSSTTTIEETKTPTSYITYTVADVGWACVVGIIGGAATMLTNSMGPILNVYLLSIRKLSPSSFVGTRAVFFCFLNLIKLPLRFATGTLGWPMIPLAGGLGCVALIGVYFGKPIMLSLSEKVFVRLELFIIVFAGLRLLWMGFYTH